MPANEPQTEQHGCIVCGKIYFLEITYGSTAAPEKCVVITPGGRCISDPHRPLVACNNHTSSQVEEALTKHYPGASQEEDEDE